MRIKPAWHKVAFVLILALSACLNFINLGQEGYANLYYAAGVKSMSADLKNFFFNSFDPGGFVTLDKPPLGFWIQAASIKLFGFSGWSLIFPQALAGVLSVAILYFIVKKPFGRAAGLLASLVLALTPIFVAISRNNTIDSLLILALLLGTGFLLKAAEKGSFKWFISAMVMVGLGFNIKMLQSFMVLPAFLIVYLLSGTIPLRKRILHLFAGIAVLLAVSLFWAAIVDLTPADKRPYVGSSKTNSVFDLIIGYNGLNRIGNFGSLFRPPLPNQPQGRAAQQQPQKPPLPGQPQGEAVLQQPQKPPLPGQPNGGGPSDEAGVPGIFRLFNQKVGGQISWLLVFSVISAAFCAWKLRYRLWADNIKKQSFLLWSLWLITMFIFFSYRQGVFHRYYLSMMAPGIAVMFGIGAAEMMKETFEKKLYGWMLSFSFLACTAAEIKILSYNYSWSKWIIDLVLILMTIAFAGLVSSLLFKKLYNKKVIRISAALGILALLTAPAAWSLTPILYGGDAALPITGPELLGGGANNRSISKPGAKMPNMDTRLNIDKLTEFLLKNNSGEKFIAAVPSAVTLGSKLVLETGKPVMALGGFAGGDKILPLPQLKEMIKYGTVRYFIIEDNLQGLNQWIRNNGKPIPNEQWQELRNSRPVNMPEGLQMYDMK